jgi:hypothetical protein
MAAEVYTTADLLSDIKQEGMVPISQSTYQVTDILRLATRMLRTEIVPLLSSVREGYFIWPGTIALQSGVTDYEIPDRSVALSLDDVKLRDSSGREVSIPVIPASDVHLYTGTSNRSYDSDVGFSLEWNTIKLTKDMYSRYTTLVVPYLIRPGYLVETSDAAKITVIDTVTNTVTVNSVPSDFTTSLTYDFIKGKGGYEYRGLDYTASSIDSNAGTITFSSTLPTNLAVNDWVAVTGESPVPQIPQEVTPILVYETLIRLLKSMGDRDGAAAAQEVLEGKDDKGGLKKSIMQLLSPRVKGETKYIIPGYRYNWERP